MSADYDAWTAALAGRFLQRRTGMPLYLYTDDGVLEELAGEVGVDTSQAVDSFVSALQSALLGGEPFRRWATAARTEVSSDSAPSYLGVLCFLVFVAVERDTVHFQYYPALNQFLGRPEHSAPPGFERDIPILFGKFNDWLSGKGREHGLATAAPTEHYPNVGWPLSQAIVRPVDRVYLARMFAKAGLAPGRKQSAAALRATVIQTIRTAGETPSRTRLMALDNSHRSTFEDVLLKEFRAWDGTTTSNLGPVRSLLRLCFDETLAEWWFLGPRLPGTEGKHWRVGGQSGSVPQFKGLEADPPELWELVGSGEVGRIQDGPVLVSPASTVRWLSIDTVAGGWAEVQRRDPEQAQLALVPAQRWAVSGLAGRLEPREDSPLGHVLATVPAQFEQAGEGAADLGGIQPSVPRLEGGLPLNAATNTYLTATHGLPVVVGVHTSVTVDGVPVPIVDSRVVLGGLGLGPGDHVIQADGKQVPLRLLERLVESPVTPVREIWTDVLVESARLRVPCSGDSVWLLGNDGELEERSPLLPGWVASLGLMANEVDLTGVVAQTWFEPTYLVSSSYMGKPWVEPVGVLALHGEHDRTRRPFDRAKARKLVTDLMHDYGPEVRKTDKRWKRSFAALMRTVHR